MNVQEYLSTLGSTLVENLTVWTPRVILGLILFVVALVVSRVLARILRSILRRVGLDALLDRLGITATLNRLGISRPASEILPKVLYYLILILVVRTAADAMGLFAISSAIGTFMAYLPNVFAAVLIMVLGATAAQVASGVVTRAAENSGIEFAKPLGGIVAALIMTMVGLMAIGQLKVDAQIVYLVVSGLMACLVLALGLSFGLGSRDVTRNILAGYYTRRTIPAGAEVEVGSQRGTLVGVGATQTLLESTTGTTVVPNGVFLDEVAVVRGKDEPVVDVPPV